MPTLEASRALHRAEVEALPATVRALEGAERYPVSRSSALERLQAEVEARVRERERGT
jgi:hypothetical protein